MRPIHVARNHQSMGRFSDEEVAEGLKSGKFVPSDLAWREPMEAWKPLAEFTDLPEGKDEESPERPGTRWEREAEAGSPETESPTGDEPAWERRKTLGGMTAMMRTVQQVLGAPAATFREMSGQGGFSGPLRYYAFLFTVTTWVAAGYQIVALRVNPAAVLGELSEKISAAEMEQSLLFFMALTPVLAVGGGAFVAAGILQAALKAVGAAKKPYEVTFRAWCYAAGSAALLQLIPLCGGMMSLMVTTVLLIIALRVIHQANSLQATLAVVGPALLGCGLFLGLYSTVL